MPENVARENLGIIVQYKVRIKLSVTGPLGGELAAELPFTLTHPKPVESPQPSLKANSNSSTAGHRAQAALDMDLIQLETTFVYLSFMPRNRK